MVFRRIRNAVAALSDPWLPTSGDELARRLWDGITSGQTSGFALGPLHIYQCYDQPPAPTPRPMITAVCLASRKMGLP